MCDNEQRTRAIKLPSCVTKNKEQGHQYEQTCHEHICTHINRSIVRGKTTN